MERGKRARMVDDMIIYIYIYQFKYKFSLKRKIISLKVDAKMVNRGFIIAFPITFIIFISYMVIQVLRPSAITCTFKILSKSLVGVFGV